jgi:hypothetical protein
VVSSKPAELASVTAPPRMQRRLGRYAIPAAVVAVQTEVKASVGKYLSQAQNYLPAE